MKVLTSLPLLLGFWTLLYLDFIPQALSIAGVAGHRGAGTAKANPRLPVARNGTTLVKPSDNAKISRIRAGPPLIKAEVNPARAAVPVSLGRREAARSWVPRDAARVASSSSIQHQAGHNKGVSAQKSPAPAAIRAGQTNTGVMKSIAPASAHLRAMKLVDREEPKHPLVTPHDYMISLYWSLTSGEVNTSILHEAGMANTITSFVDRGQGMVCLFLLLCIGEFFCMHIIGTTGASCHTAKLSQGLYLSNWEVLNQKFELKKSVSSFFSLLVANI